MKLAMHVGLAIVLAYACADSSFNGSSGKKSPRSKSPATGDAGESPDPANPSDPDVPSSDDPIPPADQPNPIVEEDPPAQPQPGDQTFTVGTKSGIDIVWTIDNSGSMDNEIAQVDKNFAAFADKISSVADLKIALITCTNSGGLCLSSSTVSKLGSKATVVNVGVGSSNALAITMSTMCPISESDTTFSFGGGKRPTVCGVEAGEPGSFSWESFDLNKSGGKLQNFFRPYSRKVFVVVTDDSAKGITDKHWDTYVSKKFATTGYTYYGFIGIDNSCSVTNRGVPYENLAKKTGGKTYNICESDWKKYFGPMSESLAKEAVRTFTVEQPRPVKITKVYLNGSLLSSSQYTVSGNSVTIAASVTLKDGDKVKIHFE
jgi:hypothetical protein